MNFDNLRDRVSNLTLYDVKAGVRQVQNGECNIIPSASRGTILDLEETDTDHTQPS